MSRKKFWTGRASGVVAREASKTSEENRGVGRAREGEKIINSGGDAFLPSRLLASEKKV